MRWSGINFAVCVATLFALYLVHGQKEAKPQRTSYPAKLDANVSTDNTAANEMVDGSFLHGEVQDGVAAFLLHPRGTSDFKRGESIYLSHGFYRPASRGSKEKICVLPPYAPSTPDDRSWISVVGHDGRAIAYKGPHVTYSPIELTSDFVSSLREGEFLGTARATELTREFSMDQPGEYTVRWHCKLTDVRLRDVQIDGKKLWWGEVSSNELKIRIHE